MRSFIINSLSLLLLFAGFVSCRKTIKWEGTLVFQDNFNGTDLRKDNWLFDDWCLGKGYKDTNLECFAKSDNNVRVINGSLIIRAMQEPWTSMSLFAKPKNYTSGRVQTIGNGFSHGTFVIRAKMPRGKHLLPAVWLLPAYQDHDNCKYEEIDIVQARGQKPSSLIFSASYGRYWNLVSTKRMEKAFPNVDFTKDFHEYALVLKPLRMDWYVDNVLVYTATTHYHTDWLLRDESNKPCSRNKSLFKQQFQLILSLSVGGKMFPSEIENSILTIEEAIAWPQPTFEIDWVKIYQI